MREFQDATGTRWTVWEVRPARGLWQGEERRVAGERRVGTGRAAGEAERRIGDRRQQTLRAIRLLGAGVAGGWLAFRAGKLRRWLSPIPAEWATLEDAGLVALCERASIRGAAGPSATDADPAE